MNSLLKKIKRWYYRRKVKDAVFVLTTLDRTFLKAGYTRAQRRRFWRNLPKDRTEVIKILKELSTGPS